MTFSDVGGRNFFFFFLLLNCNIVDGFFFPRYHRLEHFVQVCVCVGVCFNLFFNTFLSLVFYPATAFLAVLKQVHTFEKRKKNVV